MSGFYFQKTIYLQQDLFICIGGQATVP